MSHNSLVNESWGHPASGFATDLEIDLGLPSTYYEPTTSWPPGYRRPALLPTPLWGPAATSRSQGHQ